MQAVDASNRGGAVVEREVDHAELLDELHLAELRGPRSRRAQRKSQAVQSYLEKDLDGSKPWFLVDHLEVGEGGVEPAAIADDELDQAVFEDDETHRLQALSPVDAL